MNCIACNSAVEQVRLDLNMTVCSACAYKGIAQPEPVKGVMVYGHKTAGEMQIVSAGQFADHRKYNPYGRMTGRGSGVHAVMNSSNK